MSPMMRCGRTAWLAVAWICSAAAFAAEARATFPGKEWAVRKPEEAGLDAAKLRRLAELVGGRGCVVRHGTMVHSWGDPARREDVASACKPWFTHFLLVAVEKGKVPGVDEKIARWEPRLETLNASLGFKDRGITWRHLANQTSCYGVTERPGEAYDYNDYNMALFFDTLFLKVHGAEPERIDEEVLRPLLTDPIGCQDEPTLMAFGERGRLGRLGISPRDFARLGLLYLHGGEWDGKRIIRAEDVRLVTTSPLPGALPRTSGKDAEMIEGQRSLGGGKNQTDHMGSYSFAWWTNGVDREGKRHWPDVPSDAYGAFGHGGIRAMVVIPSLDLIVSWNDATVNSPERENQALGLLAASVVGGGSAPVGPESRGAMETSATGRWYERAYRRAVIDMHIPDWDPAFLSKLDPDAFAEALVRSRAQSIVLYAQSHVGIFNYPTRVGEEHRGLGGRNVLGELIARCHAKGIAVVLYTSLLHDRWASDRHPEWRICQPDGSHFGPGSRHGFVCPNSPYREHVRAWVEEICREFDFEGIRFDMTFWVGVCYCEHCKKRWRDEVGGDMPTIVDWLDERWVKLQRKREEWLADFAAVATGTVRKLKPAATVEHQSSTFPHSWAVGVAQPLVDQNDFLQGDFYGDALQGSFVRKLLESLTPHRPFGFETSFSLELRDHTGAKSEALLETKASAAIADNAAFIFIDAIDPIGTVNIRNHERMGRIFDRLMPYYQHLGGDRVQDIAVYYSLESKFDFAGSGQPAPGASRNDTHTEASMNACRWILASHLPVGVITKRSLDKLERIDGPRPPGGIRTLVLSCVNAMDDGEISAIREWVRGGGTLYASGSSSLVDTAGRKRPDLGLADVLGVSMVAANWNEREHYLAPTEGGQRYFPDFNREHPAFVRGPDMEVKAREGAEVLATTTLPWPAKDPRQFSSIHSNPPWVETDRPEIVAHRFGKGTVVYSSSLLENFPALQATFVGLLRALRPEPTFEAKAPVPVEVTLFRQGDRKRYLLGLVNFQKDLPNIPVEGIEVTLRLEGEEVHRVRRIPDGLEVPFEKTGGTVRLVAPRLETILVLAVETDA